MKRLIVIGARATGSSIALVRAALAREVAVTVITAPGHRLDGVFPDGVETVNLAPDAGPLAGWLRAHFPDELDTLRVTTAHDTYARTAAWVADALGLPGPDARHVAYAVSKSNQKALLAEHGIPAAQFVAGTLAAPAALAAAADPLRFPVVVKPSEGSASDGVRRCEDIAAVRAQLDTLAAAAQADAPELATERVVIEEFLAGSEYCVEYFDGRYVGALRKLKRHGAGFLERGYTSELDLDADTLRALIDVGTRATAAAGLTWGPVHLDCIVHDGVPHVIELNPRIAGSFICDIVRDGYGFNVVEALLDKLDGRTVTIPELFEPHAYARAEFLLDSDPGAWRFARGGEIDDGAVRISYGPQVLPDRERRAFLYVRVALPAAHSAANDAGPAAERRELKSTTESA
ncbi:ATP-grasp domain-containing protein [Burkholderia cenocepacia]|uniref:ATP-grasp domain-containing protein n=1 Tax=Burkholderia cepacia complex TaxID=87882 RepID=UPI000F57C235|nr:MULTISPECIES: ATP-grasp domain-containing protein [Burkholderia cepacia complex]ELW9450081.1 ATP-grasp domain-containing protein [Burkholderia cenocepacia]MBR8486102.1 ATP-grasp domain-containing protein [Burkholderia cenocepacia]MDN7471959.1 ATP-grasp domain-containing protein [Burkholderia orbicola]MDN7501577.1 ATP-grasp domain-containing protein [Burkholderia orbicola]RQU18322.1 ATP-grasp domain-containing protein [Burkholderia cenocepacia]